MEQSVTPGNALAHIAICGAGLAGYMTAAALSRHLPATTQITLVVVDDRPAADIFYGSVTAPSAYAFNLSMGVAEPRLVLDSNTIFSLGTYYRDWGGAGRSWVQGFQLPLPILNGVQFHQYLTRMEIYDLEPFLVSAEAAKRGAFAHPPDNNRHPLSRAEYGYQLDAASYAELFAAVVRTSSARIINAGVAAVECGPEGITGLHLSDGQNLVADLYIDATGPDATLLSRIGGRRLGERRLNATLNRGPSDAPRAAIRTLSGRDFGWQSTTSVCGAVDQLTVFTEEDEASALAALGGTPVVRASAGFGSQEHAWIGNCAAVGQAAAMIEPLTPAPLMLLQADIQRLLALIPLSGDMAMESREYNRQAGADYGHAELFRRALFATTPIDRSAYWRAATAQPIDARLERKIEQFLSRGLLVSYDLEPFTPEDWVILHYGMGRRPVRRDRLVDQVPAAEVDTYLASLRRDIVAAAARMPAHDTYRADLKRFLIQKGL